MSISPPRPKGPPLGALRAFEAAARLGGFSMAADELCVTPGAISQHIKSLEDWTGAPLFERRSQGVTMTPLGAETAAQFSTAFDSLGMAVRALRTGARQTTINIAALPSVAQLWLSPRLPAIRAALGEYEISVTALETPPNLNREMFDISVFLGEPEGREAELILAKDVIFPVCSPDIARRLKEPADLLNETWLYDVLWADDWAFWTERVDPDLARPRNGPCFSPYSIAVEEAKSGAGVLIGHEALVGGLVKKGDLAAPFSQAVPTGKSLYLEIAADTSLPAAPARIAAMLGA